MLIIINFFKHFDYALFVLFVIHMYAPPSNTEQLFEIPLFKIYTM